jgi:hypothetical protein
MRPSALRSASFSCGCELESLPDARRLPPALVVGLRRRRPLGVAARAAQVRHGGPTPALRPATLSPQRTPALPLPVHREFQGAELFDGRSSACESARDACWFRGARSRKPPLARVVATRERAGASVADESPSSRERGVQRKACPGMRASRLRCVPVDNIQTLP